MVNSCTGKVGLLVAPTQETACFLLVTTFFISFDPDLVQMGHATAEAVIRAGLTLVPFSFTGRSEAVAVGNVGVCGVPVELVTPPERQAALDRIKEEYPNLVAVDYTLPSAVNGEY